MNKILTCCLVFVLLTTAKLNAQISYALGKSGTATIHSDYGYIYDNGGASFDYDNNTDFTLVVVGDSSTQNYELNFFNTPIIDRYDTLEIFDGVGVNANNLLYTSANTLTGFVTTTNHAFTVRFRSNNTLGPAGFQLYYTSFYISPAFNATVEYVLANRHMVSPDIAYPVNIKFMNATNAAVPVVHYGVYLSTDNVWDTTDILLLQDSLYSAISLNANTARIQTENYKIPAGTALGEYHLIAYLDNKNAFTEPDENDNFYALPIRVGSGYDLDLNPLFDIDSSAPGGTVGGAFTFRNYSSFTVYHRAQMFLSTDTIIDGGDIVLSDNYMNATAGLVQTYSVGTLAGNITPGLYYLIAVVDADDTYAETPETNNTAIAQLLIKTAVPDYTFTNAPFSTTQGYFAKGLTQNGRISVYNRGGASSTQNMTLNVFFSKDSILGTGDYRIHTGTVSGTISAGGSTLQSLGSLSALASCPLSGPGYVISKIDTPSQIAETNENNNTAIQPMVLWTGTADFFIMGSNTDGSFPTAYITSSSAQVQTNVYLGNQSPASDCEETYTYFSFDSVYSAGDQLLGSINCTSSFAKGYRAGANSISVTLPTGLANGTYYLIHKTNFADFDTTNNIRVQRVDKVPNYVDLAITSMSVNAPAIITPDLMVRINCSLRNDGQLLSPAFAVAYYASLDNVVDGSDVLLDTFMMAPLQDGSSYNLTPYVHLPASLAVDTYNIIVVVDYLNQVNEFFENNNIMSKSIILVAKKPDLRVNDFTIVSPQTLGYSNTVTVSVDNYGSLSVNSNIVSIYLSNNNVLSVDDILLDTIHYGPTADSLYTGGPDVSKEIMFPSTLPAGNKYLIAKVDGDDAIDEYIETNNTNAKPITLANPTRNFMLGNLSSNVSGYFNGNTVQITYTVSESSNYTYIPARVALYYSANNILDAGDVVLDSNAINLNAQTNLQIVTRSVTLPANLVAVTSSGYIFAKVDFTDAEVESSETDNVAYISGTFHKPIYDLDLQYSDLNNAAQCPGAVIGYSYEATNTTYYTAPPVNMGIYLSSDINLSGNDVLISTFTAYIQDNLPSWQDMFTQFTIPMGTVPGTYYVILKADYDNTLVETNESNNTTFTIINVDDCQPQLYPGTLTLSANEAVPNDVITYSLRVYNGGFVDAPSVTYGVVLSGDDVYGNAGDVVLDTGTVYQVTSGGFKQITGSFTVPSNGQQLMYYRVVVKVDANNVYQENNESNNSISESLKVEDIIQSIGQTEGNKPDAFVYANTSTLKVLNAEGTSLAIYDIQGSLIYSTSISDNGYEVSLSGVSNGVYLITIAKNGVAYHKKVVISR